MLRRITAAQFREWLAYFELEPFGPAREDLRAGAIAAAVYNSSLGRKKGSRAIKPSDVFENLRVAQPKQTADQMAQRAKAISRAMGGKVVKKGERVGGKAERSQPTPKPVRKGKTSAKKRGR